MTTKSIQRVAVLGSGVMGQGIASHLANAGVPAILFDLPLDGYTFRESDDPRAIARDGIKNATKLKPASFFRKEDTAMVTPASFDHDGELLKGCDLIIEVVAERLDIKRKVFAWVARNRKEGSILTSNTSGIPLGDMAAEMSEELRQHFMITHFFNPVRYMRLLELVTGPDTKDEVVDLIADFGARRLGKGIVYGKDTPNFIANRIGTYGMVSVFKHMDRLGADVETVDVVFGSPMGRAKSAVFRTADLVGLDTLDHVFGNVYNNCTEDEEREGFKSPVWLRKMIDEGTLGNKTGKGFYQKSKDGNGKRLIMVRDLGTGEYAPVRKPRFDSVKAAKKAGGTGSSIKAMIGGEDIASQLAWACTSDILVYSANRIPEIADDVVNIDRGMKWGFGWELGPFETWDAIGVRESVGRMESEGRAVTTWVKNMLDSGRESFYAREGGKVTYWDPSSGSAKPVPSHRSWLLLKDITSERSNIVKSNPSANLLDLGDGILGLEFRSKMNVIETGNVQMYSDALDLLDDGQYRGLVVGNQDGRAFCAGANIFMVLMGAMQGQWDQIEKLISDLQTTLQRAKYCNAPVVTAPYGLTLGGGCEIAMHSAATQAGGELYMGLVEVGVGLLPAGGGCKEMLARYLGDIPEGTEYDPNPFVQQAFKNIALGQVSSSCEEARKMGYLRAADRVTMDPDALISDAKALALGLAEAGYRAPRKRRFKLPGSDGRSAIELFLYQMQQGGYASEHDVAVGKEIAYVMTGGSKPSGTWSTEEDILELERQGFLKLLGTKKTHARIQHMLQTNKPLRN
jgi:3-hydroxyacyl-CoA dehydrogenase